MKFLSSKVTIALFFSVFLTSCESGTVETAGPTELSSTTYSGTLTSVTLSTSDPSINPTGQATITATVTFNLSVDDMGTLTGVVNISDPNTNCFSGGPITGTVTGSNINFTITDGIAGPVNFSGTFTGTSLTGSYSRSDTITSVTTSTQSTSSTTSVTSGTPPTTTTTSSQSSTPTNVFSGCPAHSGTIEANA